MAERLTLPQLAALKAVLTRFADGIDRVDVHGSRATLGHRPGSDLDLVLHGSISTHEVAMLACALEESFISISVDVVNYRDIGSKRFRDEVDRTAVPLLDKTDLVNAT